MTHRNIKIHRNPKGATITFLAVVRGVCIERPTLARLKQAMDEALK